MNQIIGKIVVILFCLTFFSSSFKVAVPAIGYADELLVIFVFAVALAGGKMKRAHFRILALLLLFWLYVMLSSPFSRYYQGGGLTALDLLLFSKPVLLYIGLMNLPINVLEKIRPFIFVFMCLYLLCAFIFYFVNLAMPIFPEGDRRFGIAAYSFIASNEGEFANLVLLAGVLVYGLGRDKWTRLIAGALMSFLALVSLRYKAIVLAALFFLMSSTRNLGLIKSRAASGSFAENLTHKRINISYLLAMLPLGLVLGASQFSKYFFGEVTPRLFLVQNALAVASDFFPFGAGAGTFGSAVSKIQYSNLYNDLAMSGFWGLSEDDSRFLSDSFWPMVVAQYGVIGTVLVLAIYGTIARRVVGRWAASYERLVGSAIILISIVLSTLGSAILIGHLGALLIFGLVLLIRDN